jgi:uncharacterized protein DUF4365
LRSWEPPGPRKRRTREHVIADLSVNHLERFVLRSGGTVQRTTSDYGIDLFMKTYNSAGEPEPGEVLFQVKATDKLRVRADGKAAGLRFAWSDVRSWLAEPMPVIVVLYDAAGDKAYWIHVQAYFVGGMHRLSRRTATTTVYFPIRNVVNDTAVRKFGGFRDAVLERIPRVFP